MSNTTGQNNTASGAFALFDNAIGGSNTASGFASLGNNTTGNFKTAHGVNALLNNTTGDSNTATGSRALLNNTTGGFNTANGDTVLANNTTGFSNTATGGSALFSNTTGTGNTALGYNAGSNQDTGSDNVYIGAGMVGVPGESNACYIRSIFGQTAASGIPVLIDSNNKLGTIISSKRFKEDIKPMAKASDGLYALTPVTFHYKKEIDPASIAQFGLVAEDAEAVNPDLVVRDREGKPYSVRYDQVNAMLLNEFLKEHRKVEKLEATVASLAATAKEQAAQLQKVNAEVGINKPALKVVSTNS